MDDQKIRQQIKETIAAINPFDQTEEAHIKSTIAWIDSGAEIFRIQKDALPPKHLVSYALVIDRKDQKILLLNHKKALLLLPSGGHVDIGELPVDAAVRELKEELDLSLELYDPENDASVPFFISVADTVGISEKHTDVSLWYIFESNGEVVLNKNNEEFIREFDGYRWLGYDEILAMPLSEFDPSMHRFVEKLIECPTDYTP